MDFASGWGMLSIRILRRGENAVSDPIKNITNLIIEEAYNRIEGNENLIRGIHLVHYQVNLRLLVVINEEKRKAEIAQRLKKEMGSE